MKQFSRNEALIGAVGQKKLFDSSVLLVGVGGVGGYALEMLVRSGIGKVTLVDMDCVDETNLNRQILALHSTIGKPKVEVAEKRVREICPQTQVTPLCRRFTAESAAEILFGKKFDYCIDAIDNVRDKTALILACRDAKIPCLSAMGAGNRLTAAFSVTDLFSTSDDGLARAMRRTLRKENIETHKCVCAQTSAEVNAVPVASISYAPALMGCLIAAEVIKDILCR